jgi:hypothetical protein
VRITLPFAIALLVAASTAAACDTPVYRYAMYNWSPATYDVFYLHVGRPAAEDRDVNEQLAHPEKESPAAANVAFWSVDTRGKEKFDQLPEPVQAAWKSRPAGATALHVLVSPRGAPLFAGRLNKTDAASLFESPLRRRIGELLHDGYAAVLLVLDCPDKNRTRKAEQAVDEVVAQANAGKIGVATIGDSADAPRPHTNPTANAETDGPRTPSLLKLARLSVARTDKAEAWLVRTLLTVETDLDQYATQPMVFAVFGRGRALPPFVGKGIVVGNLTECVTFLAGACSCQLKDENPGIDLPMRWDWQATVEVLAADDKDFDGGQPGYREVAASPPARAAMPTRLSSATMSAALPVPAARPLATGKAARAARLDLPAQRDAAKPGVASFATQQISIYGTGVAVAAVLVLAAGSVLLLRKSSGRVLP